MRFTAVPLLASFLLLETRAIGLIERQDGAAAVVGLDLQRSPVANPVMRDRLRRRSKTVTETLDNLQALYFSNATLGTPAQQFRFHIDTGSSDLWSNSPNSRLCLSRSDPCVDSGSYNANKSTSYNYVNSGFNISYADGSGATGDYATDTISLGGATIPGLQFGIGYQSTSPESVLGIGYALHEAQVILAGANPYANLPELMVRMGLINSPAYSLWLNDLTASTGSLLFGGVNTEKYHGQLSSLPIQTGPGQLQPEELFITLTGVQFGGSSLVSSRADAALLDSGSSLIYLPDEIAGAIYKVVGAQIDQSRGVAVVPCSMANSPQTLDFTFSGPTISVPMSELVLPGPNSQLSGTFGQSGSSQKMCTLAIIPNGGSNTVLGDPFLRSAYVVYDLANNMISIAQTNFNATQDRILEIGSGPGAVPDAVLIQNPVTATAPRGGATGSGRLRPTAAASGTASGAKPGKTGGAIHGRSSPTGGALAGIFGAIAVAFVL